MGKMRKQMADCVMPTSPQGTGEAKYHIQYKVLYEARTIQGSWRSELDIIHKQHYGGQVEFLILSHQKPTNVRHAEPPYTVNEQH